MTDDLLEPFPNTTDTKQILCFITSKCLNENVFKTFYDWLDLVLNSCHHCELAIETSLIINQDIITSIGKKNATGYILKISFINKDMKSSKPFQRFFPVKDGKIVEVCTLEFIDNTTIH